MFWLCFVLVICLSHTNTSFSLFHVHTFHPVCHVFHSYLVLLTPCLVLIFCWCSPELSPYRPLDAPHAPQTMVIHEGKLQGIVVK